VERAFLRIKAKIKSLLKNRFVRSVILISGGTAFAQVVAMLSSPIITRIYSPEEYGIFTLFNSTLAIVALVGSLKYELCIPIVEDDEQSINSLSLSFFVLTIFVLATTLILVIFRVYLLRIIGAEKLINYWYLIPIGILFTQTYRILRQYAYRQKNFKGITQTVGIQSLVGNLLKIITGLFGFGVIGLLSSKILSESVGMTTLSKPLIKNKELFNKVRPQKMKWIAKRYIKFPLYQFPSTLVGQVSINLPVFFLGFIYNSQVVGAFGLANTIVRLPMNLIGKSVSNVFFAEAASIGRTNPKMLKDLSDKLFKKLLIIGLLPLLVLLLYAPFLFTFIFGESWTEAGNFARILSVLVFSDFIFSPVSRVFEILEKQVQMLFLNIIRVIFSIIAFGIAIIFYSSQYFTVLMYTVVMSLTYFLTYLMAQKYMKNAIREKY
jgi:O-antigen/teichoic acid export membrane protein